jgi:ADP-ribosylglycohydrolase
MTPLPVDYLERVYAGVLGKIIGVYVGRPFEGWTHQRIVQELGAIHHYVHEKLGAPLVVTDDDVSGTFAFVRALEEHGATAELSAEDIGKTWLNNVIEDRTIFWWGGRGISTEHTAFLNLKKGISAPHSGSIQTNGKTVAEQIGAQIFIDGWALVAPGSPSLAAKLAKAAGSVSHDGESVHAAILWAAMEAEAFISKDVDHLIDVGLKYIPNDSLIATLIGDVRSWVKEDGDWRKTRQRIEDKYGYDKFCGVCHVVPNHGIMVMALVYAGHNFHEAIHIINTCGWDTDCNSGNVGCLVAIMNGLTTFEGGPDWRGPLADRALISSADGGYSINNAGRIAYDIANMGRRLADQLPLDPPKDGAQFHFSLPGSVQGFQITGDHVAVHDAVSLEQAVDDLNSPSLAIRLRGLTSGKQFSEIGIVYYICFRSSALPPIHATIVSIPFQDNR